jgi:vanillate O-demethylase monooxygenase subunit
VSELANYPLDCWYVAAMSHEVRHAPLGRTLLDVPVVLYRTDGGDVVALSDRCAHRGYPLSRGRLEGDVLVCGYHGLRYDPQGSVVRVPSQEHVPFGACVQAYPVREQAPYMWIWLGDPRRSSLSPIPDLPWLTDAGWTSSGTTVLVAANYMQLHEHYLDLTHIPEVHPVETPLGMEELPPFDVVEVSETTARYERQLPPAPLADWEANWSGLPRDRDYDRRHRATFLSPAVLVDDWTIATPGAPAPQVARVQAVTPQDATTTHLFWRLARNHEAVPGAGDGLHDVLEQVMRIDVGVIETIQATVGYEGSKTGLHVNADAGVLRLRRIVAGMLAAEAGGHSRFGLVRPGI